MPARRQRRIPATPPRRPELQPRPLRLTVLLGGLAALPPLAIDIGLPALPQIGVALRGSAAAAGLTLSLFMLGFALTQLALGPLSDRVGRRPVLLGGMVVFTAGGLGSALAPTMAWLLWMRLLEGGGAAAGSVMAYAIVRDLFEGAEARKKFAAVAVVTSVAPIVAPSLGALILAVATWRSIYGALALAGLVLTAGVAGWLGETRPPLTGVRPGLVRSYRRVLGHRRVRGFVLANAMSFGSMFAYVAGSPLLFIGRMGVSVALFSVLFATTAGAIMAGAVCAGRLARAGVGVDLSLRAGIVGQAASACALVPALLVTPRMEIVLPLLVVNTFCRGLFVPTVTHAAMEPMPDVAGTTAAVLGCSQMVVGAVASAAVAGLFPALGPFAMALTMAVCGVAGLVLSVRAAERRNAP